MALVEDWSGAEVHSGGDPGLAKRVSAALRAEECVKDRAYVVGEGLEHLWRSVPNGFRSSQARSTIVLRYQGTDSLRDTAGL